MIKTAEELKQEFIDRWLPFINNSGIVNDDDCIVLKTENEEDRYLLSVADLNHKC